MSLNQANFAPHFREGGPIILDAAGQNKVDIALMRLHEFEPEEGYYLAMSGGKDSQVCYDLAERSGVKFQAYYNLALDPPQLIQFLRRQYPTVIFQRAPDFNFYRSLEEKGFPTRKARWCCEYMKEYGGGGRVVITGVRWQESTRRKARRMVDRGGQGRVMTVMRKAEKPKVCVNPIIDWTTKEVWEYLKGRGLPYCELYDVGSSGPYKGNGHFKRLGCVLCPMESRKQTLYELEYFPKQAEALHRAFVRLYERRKASGAESIERWPTAEAMWLWWLSRENQGPADSRCMAFW